MAKLRNRFNISVAEVALNDVHRSAQLGAALVSNDKVHVDQTIAKIVGIIDAVPDMHIVDYRVEIL